jgi:hypothetical protein
MRSSVFFALDGYGDFNLLTKAAEDGHQPVHRKSPEVGIADSGKVCRSDMGDRLGFANRKAAIVERTNYFGCEQSFQLMQFRVWPAEIAEDIPTASDRFDFGTIRPGSNHRACSFNDLIRLRVEYDKRPLNSPASRKNVSCPDISLLSVTLAIQHRVA